MASLGHVAVGLAGARVHRAGATPTLIAMTFWSGLSLLPDIDVIGFTLRVPYGAPWGHRGATHSLGFAIVVALIIGFIARVFGKSLLRTGIVAVVVLISHSLLDTMTDGGLGCALLWPFSDVRYFAPWRPIPVAPIGLGFLSSGGLAVAGAEVVLFAPVLLYAVIRRPFARASVGMLLVLWLLAVSLFGFSDRARDAIIGVVLREDTRYAPGFSETAFRTAAAGQSQSEVLRRLGPPVREHWFYTASGAVPPDERPASSEPGCFSVRFDEGIVAGTHQFADCARRGVATGMSAAVVQTRLGPPLESCWQYSWTPAEASYRQRLVCFSGTTVHLVVSKWS